MVSSGRLAKGKRNKRERGCFTLRTGMVKEWQTTLVCLRLNKVSNCIGSLLDIEQSIQLHLRGILERQEEFMEVLLWALGTLVHSV